jgi:transketolase
LTTTDLDTLSINTIRGLAMDEVQKANSGHPGTPMGIAPVAYTLWQRFMCFDPSDPIWPNRDRFVLSEGHASALLWALLHLTGVRAVDPDYEVLGTPAVTMEDLKTFRQLGSHCPGHPEYRLTSGVEATTGPLGQGVATSVGMAIAGQWLAARYNRDGFPLFDYNVYALAGDGCMMEGISSEAASLAGHLELSNLCWIYDSNRVTIEGHTDIAFTEDVAARFIAYGWNVTTVADVNDLGSVARALHSFRTEHERPTLMLVHSHIGYGSPVEDAPKAHGEPLGAEAVKVTKRFLGMPEDKDFYVPDGVYECFADGIGKRGKDARAAWETLFKDYRAAYPELADQVDQMQHRTLPDGWDADLPAFPPDPKGIATRDSSSQVLNAVARHVPWLVGGSADLTPSTKTHLTFDGAGSGQPDAILTATGSEVQLALEARDELEADGIATRVVSTPCWELFDRQPAEYRDRVLPRAVKARIAAEQASTLGWDRYVGDGGAVVGMHTFGASAPLKQLLTHFGFTPEHLSQVARERVAAAREQAAS